MENLNRKKIFNIIFLLIFLGIILSFSLFFFMVGSIEGRDNSGGEFFGLTYGVSDGDLFAYDSNFMKNPTLHAMIIESEYQMFGSIKQGDIIKGKHEFLFEFGQNKYGYDYASDYMGRSELTESELEAFREAVLLRQKIYANQGRYYILAVIPNSQTVYSEYMPQYLLMGGGETALSKLSAYMNKNGVDCYLDLTEYIKNAKGNEVLYNNTENSVNAMGAYYIYSAIMDSLPSDIVSPDRKLSVNDYSYFTHYTNGKGTAIDAGLEFLIKNETVSMSNSTEFKYTVVDHSEGLSTTYVKSAYKNEVSAKPSVMIDYSGEWDKIQLMPYFSNTFGVSSYRAGHTYDAEIMASINPLVVIQTIHEYEISALLDTAVNGSYRNALGQEATPYKTMMPSEVAYTVLSSSSVCISGTIENDAEVRVFGEGISPISVKAIDGRFFVEVSFDGNVQNKEIFIDAKSADKAASDHISLVVSGTNNVGSARDVVIGSNSMLYKSDYGILYNLPSKEELDEYKIGFFNSVSLIKDTSENFGLSMIYASIPQKLTVYTDGMPDALAGQRERVQALEDMLEAILDRAAIEFVDLSDTLREHAKTEKMFYQTDDYITDMAYYYMYCEILGRMARASEQYGNWLKPMKAEQFLEYSFPLSTGVLASSLGFDMSHFTEKITRLRFNNGKNVVYNSDGSFEYYGNNDDAPSAIIVYDNNCEPLIGLLAEHFEYVYVMKKGETSIPGNILSSVSPDFIIYLCDEANIDFTADY